VVGTRRKQAFKIATEELVTSLGGIKRPVEITDIALRTLYRDGDYEGMVKNIRDHMKLRVRILLRISHDENEGMRGAPAWICFPKSMPSYGTSEYDRLVVTIFVRRSFLQRSTFEAVVVIIAHELSHIVLEAIGHRLRKYEKAVDLTAMILGYRLFYLVGSTYTPRPTDFWEKIVMYYNVRLFGHRPYRKLGYLSEIEIKYVCSLLTKKAAP